MRQGPSVKGTSGLNLCWYYLPSNDTYLEFLKQRLRDQVLFIDLNLGASNTCPGTKECF